MNSPFKLLIFTITAIALIYIIITLFSPYLISREDIFKSIEASLATSEGFKGKFNSKTILYPSNFSFKASSFDTKNRSVNFSCNEGSICCPINEKCGRIEWDERYIYFSKSENIVTSTRCDYAHGLFACTVYFGKEPAQLKLTNVPKKLDLDASTTQQLLFSFDIQNLGGKPVINLINSTVKVYQELVFEDEKERVFKFQDTQTFERLAVGETKKISFNIPFNAINQNGNYVIEVKTEARDAGFDEKTINLIVTNATSFRCTADKAGSAYLDNETCKRNLYCKNCNLAVECTKAWEEKLQVQNLEIVDPEFTYQILPLTECK